MKSISVRRFPRELRWILAQMSPYKQLYAGSLACTGLGGLMALIDPLIVKWLIDVVVPHKSLRLLLIAAASFLFVFFARLILNNVAAVLNFRATHSVLLRIRTFTLRHLQSLAAEFYDRNQVGNTTFRVEQDVDKLREVGGDFVLTFARTAWFSVLILGTMLAMNLPLTCVLFPLIPLFLIVRRKYDSSLRYWSEVIRERSGESSSFLYECLSSIIQIQILRREMTQLRRFFRLSRSALEAQIGRRKAEAFYGTFSSLVIALGLALVLSLGGYAVVRNTLTIGALVAFYSYLTRLFEPLSGAVDLHTRVPQLRVSIARILELLDTCPAIADHPGAVAVGNISAESIVFRDVRFSYGDRKVLENFNCEIKPGVKLVLVGPSGSGKSTIAKLLLRLYDVHAGEILIGGRDIRRLQLKGLREAISLVPQEPLLFNGTLRDNILLGDPRASKKDIDDAIRVSGLENVIGKLPQGANEYIGPRGAMLSGGEKQRVALAQALLRKPQVVLLGESTSALDGPTEAAVLNVLGTYCQRQTLLFISHRPSVMLWADQILLLNNHELVATGSHDQLYENSPLYRKIFSEQFEKEGQLNLGFPDAMEQAIT